MDWLTKQKTYVWLIILLVVINLTTLIFLWVGRPDPPEFSERKRPDTNKFLKNELGLDDDQDKKLKELREELFDTTETLRELLGNKNQLLQEESFKETPDLEKVNTLVAEIGELEAQSEMLRFNHFALVKKVLTEEQSKKFKALIGENKKHKPGRDDGERQGPPPPPPDGFPPPEM